MLERNGRRAVSPFGSLVWEPQNNVYVRPDDTVYLYREPQTFLAFGATAIQGVAQTGGKGIFNFNFWHISLAEALGEIGGLSDSNADPTSIFLFRGEPREVVQQLGYDCSHFPENYPGDLPDQYARPCRPVSRAQVEMSNKDVIYIANAPSVEATKAMSFFRTVVGTVNDPMVAAINFYALKAAAGQATQSTSRWLEVGRECRWWHRDRCRLVSRIKIRDASLKCVPFCFCATHARAVDFMI